MSARPDGETSAGTSPGVPGGPPRRRLLLRRAVHGDILEPDSLAGAPDGVTDVLHMAAVPRTSDAGTIRRVNVEGTRTLLGAMRARAPGARFLLASTSLVHGQGRTRPAREDDPTTAEAPARRRSCSPKCWSGRAV